MIVMKLRWKYFQMILVWLVCLASSSLAQQQFYTVLAPDTIRPNNNYLVAISVEGTGGDLQVSCKPGSYCGFDKPLPLPVQQCIVMSRNGSRFKEILVVRNNQTMLYGLQLMNWPYRQIVQLN